MTKWSYTGTQAKNYSTLGFRAEVGAILDGTTFSPAITSAPDVFNWTVYGGGSAQTGITAIWPNGTTTPTEPPVDGLLPVYRRDIGTLDYIEPADWILQDGVGDALSASFTLSEPVPKRYVSQYGDDDNEGRIESQAFATVAAAKQACPDGGEIVVSSPGVVPLGQANLDLGHRSLRAVNQRATVLTVPAGSAPCALKMSQPAGELLGFTLDTSGATLARAIHVAAGYTKIDDVQVRGNGHTVGIGNVPGDNAGNVRIGGQAACEVYDATTGLDFNGDGGTELFIGHVLVTRTTTGAFSGMRFVRTTAADTGAVYLTQPNVVRGAGTLEYGLLVDGSAASSTVQMPVFVGTEAVFDSATVAATYAAKVANLTVQPGAWLTCLGNGSALRLVDCGTPRALGATLQPSGTGYAIDMTTGVTNGGQFFGNKQSGGTLFGVASGNPPTNLMHGLNAGYTTFANDAAVLRAASIIAKTGPQSIDGSLEVVGDLFPNGSFAHYGNYMGFFGVGAYGRQTVTGSRGGNAALTSLLSKLDLHGVIIDGTTA